MRCSEVEVEWDALRETSRSQDEPIVRHLQQCRSCQAIFQANERVVASLAHLAVADAPADLCERVLKRLERLHTPPRGTVTLTRIDSPIGGLFIAYNETQISFLTIDRGESLETIIERVERRLRRHPAVSEPDSWVRRAIEHFFSTWSIDPSLLDISSLSPFEAAALQIAARIPPGEVRSYGWIARELGRPRAARAVGRAMARNPLALLFPCHRVVNAAGALHQYGYGLELKARLLAMEGRMKNDR